MVRRHSAIQKPDKITQIINKLKPRVQYLNDRGFQNPNLYKSGFECIQIFNCSLEWRSEKQTSSVFEWSKPFRSLNGLLFRSWLE